MENNFESAFESFLEDKDYDNAENALFSMIRISFTAGWIAAGGSISKPDKIINLRDKNILTLHHIQK